MMDIKIQAFGKGETRKRKEMQRLQELNQSRAGMEKLKNMGPKEEQPESPLTEEDLRKLKRAEEKRERRRKRNERDRLPGKRPGM
jgi:hypothetical protein